MTNTGQQASTHPRWDAWKRSFKESNYITDFWTWLLTLLSKSAELVLFGSILYSSYQLVPNVPPVPPTIDAFLFLVQQAALDIGGMGLLKLAKRAGLSKASFPMRVGVTLVVLMILNMVLASVKHALPMVPGEVFVAIETLLLIARAVMAVLFGHAIHALREDYGESTITLKDACAFSEQLTELSERLTESEHHLTQRLTELTEHFTESEHRVTEHLQRTANRLSVQLSERLEHVVSEHSTHHEVASISETLGVHAHALIELATLPAFLEELRQEVATMKQQLHTEHFSEKANNTRPKLSLVEATTEHRLPNIAPKERTANTESDKGAFVRSCLAETPNIRNTDIQRKASEQGMTISPAYISEVRKAFTSEQSA